MSELDEKAKRHRRMSLMRFHAEFCTAADDGAYAGEPDVHELELRDFVKLILAGVEQGDVPIWGMDAAAGMQAMRQYLKGVEYGQTHTWIASGDSAPEYVKRGAHSLPELLHLEMFTLERIEVDPVHLLEWMREREDTAALLREQPRHEAALAAKDAELEQARAEAAALREENAALKAALEQARQQESQGMRWYGLIAVVEQARKAGLTPQETAASLKAAGASYAVIAGLLHPEGDIKDWLQYGKNLLAGMVKEKLPW